MDFDTLDGDDLNRAIATQLRWREITPGRWLRPLDNNSTPRMVMTKLSDWSEHPGSAIQHLIDDGFGFTVSYDPTGSLMLLFDSGDSRSFAGERAWHHLQLTLIRAWLKWRTSEGG
jgi:hypothetical protein